MSDFFRFRYSDVADIAPVANYRSIVVVIRKTNQAWKTQNSSNVLVGNFEIFINSHHECFDNHLLMMIYCGNLIHWQVIFKVGQNSKKFFCVKKSSNEQRLRLKINIIKNTHTIEILFSLTAVLFYPLIVILSFYPFTYKYLKDF